MAGHISFALIFTLKQVVPGIYAAVAKELFKVNSNAAVIPLDASVVEILKAYRVVSADQN